MFNKSGNQWLRSPTTPRFPSLFLALCLLAPPLACADPVADRLAITDVLTQYSYRWDGKDAVGFADLFTEDAVMERHRNGELVPGTRVDGKQAIHDYARKSHQGRLADRQSRHHFSGIVFLELNAESAITENMALITHQTASDSAPVILASGIYRNTWRKTAAGWRISKRILTVDQFHTD